MLCLTFFILFWENNSSLPSFFMRMMTSHQNGHDVSSLFKKRSPLIVLHKHINSQWRRCRFSFIQRRIKDTKQEKYSSKYDHIDVNAVLANSRLRNQYINCLNGSAPCNTGASRFLKEKFAEAFVTRCKKCTERQIYFFDTIIDWFTKNDPETWNHLVKMAIKELQKKSEKEN
ncbi:putative odorant-binding protein A10 [Anoplolepis gracilipes]|uniref:putative odorant-binding protein A10 n=1 Tax=Anoplolepis gracilipes TaxID=354296 RepID=UPI003B9EE69D